MMVLLVILSGVIILNYISAVLSLYENYPFYRSVYKNLPNMRFYKLGSIVVGCNSDGYDLGFEYHYQTKIFQLCKNHYIFENGLTKSDPYTYYWYRKYLKWCEKNIDVDNLLNFFDRVLRFELLDTLDLYESVENGLNTIKRKKDSQVILIEFINYGWSWYDMEGFTYFLEINDPFNNKEHLLYLISPKLHSDFIWDEIDTYPKPERL